METNYLESIRKQFAYYKLLGDKTLERLTEEQIHRLPDAHSNSIAVIVKHLWGNMLSRWTDFLTTDGEKEWRQRDAEFEDDGISKSAVLERWEEGWRCLFTAVNALQPEDLERIIYIRNTGHTVMEAINRQLAHYPYHIGQIVQLGKMMCGEHWESLSIPKGNSSAYNAAHFSKEKHRGHFTDEILGKDDK